MGAGAARIVALTNVTAQEQRVALDEAALGGRAPGLRDLLSGRRFGLRDGRLELTLRPYGVAWLEAVEARPGGARSA